MVNKEWGVKYWDLLYDVCTNESIDKARKMIHENFPDRLYRYRSFKNEYGLSELKNNTVWLSCPNDFNDPYDTSFL